MSILQDFGLVLASSLISNTNNRYSYSGRDSSSLARQNQIDHQRIPFTTIAIRRIFLQGSHLAKIDPFSFQTPLSAIKLTNYVSFDYERYINRQIEPCRSRKRPSSNEGDASG